MHNSQTTLGLLQYLQYIAFVIIETQAKMEQVNLQELYFDRIRAVLPSNASLVDELAELLQISNDSVYRRLRNETLLNIEEIVRLCNHFKIPFDITTTSDSNLVPFSYSRLKNTDDFKSYLRRISQDMHAIRKAEKSKITYAAIDIPIFHHYQFPQLAAFKTFYWLKGVMNDTSLNGQKFNASLIDAELLDLGKEVYNLYCQIPGIEIWTTETVNSQFEQIQFFWESGLFQSKDDALEICNLCHQELEHIQQQADCGSKELDPLKRTSNNSFMLYHSEIQIGNNAIMVEKGESKGFYISCHTLNYMFTTQPAYCKDTQEWFDNLIRKSVLISGVSEKLRYQFFQNAYDKLEVLTKKIEG